MKKKIHFKLPLLLGIAALFSACDERVITRSETQYFTVTDFTNPIVSTLNPVSEYPNRLKIKVKGTIDKPIIMTVWAGTNPSTQKEFLRDTINASQAVNFSFDEDFYQNDTLQLKLSGSKSTSGALSVEWTRI